MRPLLAALAALVLAVTPVIAPTVASPAAASDAGDTVDPVPVMMILDASGSMAAADMGDDGQTRMAAAKTAAKDLVDGLDDTAQVGLMTYGTGTGSSDAEKAEGCRDISVLRGVESVDKEAMKGDIDGIQESGYTPIGAALEKAAEELPAEGPRSIVLLSDGEDTCAPPPPCDVAKNLSGAGTDVSVHSVGLKVDDATREELECISESTGGTYADAEDAESLVGSLTAATETALEDYDPAGTPITGGSDTASATDIAPGQYLDTLDRSGASEDEGASRTYRFSLEEGQRAFIGATLVAERLVNGEGSYASNNISLDVTDAQGESCYLKASERGDTKTSSKMFPTALVETEFVGDEDAIGCFEAPGEYVVEVTRSGGDSSQYDVPFPVELNLVLQSRGEAIAAPSATPSPAVQEFLGEPGESTPTAAGQSYNSAPALEPGTYRSSMRRGESQYYKVPVGYGQQLRGRVDVPSNEGWDTGDMILSMELVSPLREEIQALRPGDEGTVNEGNAMTGSRGVVSTTNAPYTLKENMAFPVDASYREGNFYDAGTSFAPGYYYVMVSASEPGYDAGEAPEVVNYTLQVDAVGEVQDGPEISGADVAAPPQVPEEADAGFASDLSPAALAGIGIGGALVIAGAAVGAFLLVRSRRG